MAAMRAVVPHFSKSSMAVFSRCCAAARRATRAAGVVGDPSACRFMSTFIVGDPSACRFMSTFIVGDDYATGFSSHGDAFMGVISRICTSARRDTLAAGFVGDYPDCRLISAPISEDEEATGLASARRYALAARVVRFYSNNEHHSYDKLATGFASILGSLRGDWSGHKEEDTTGGQTPGPSTKLTLQEALDMIKKLDLDASERNIFLKAVDNKFNLYKSPAEVAKGIRKMELKTIAEMTWILEALYVKCGPWIYVVDHLLKKRGIKQQPDFTMDEYEESPSEMRTELKIDRVLQGQRVAMDILGGMSKTLSGLEKPPVPMFSITICGRTIDFSGLLWWKL